MVYKNRFTDEQWSILPYMFKCYCGDTLERDDAIECPCGAQLELGIALANTLLALKSVPDSDSLFVAAGRLEAVDIFTDSNTSSELVSQLRLFATAIRGYEAALAILVQDRD